MAYGLLKYLMTDYVSFRNQSIDLLCKLTDWFLYDRDLRHERVKLPEGSIDFTNIVKLNCDMQF